MKGFRSTGVFTALVVLIAGYTAWDYHKAGTESDADTAQEKKLFHFKNEDVNEIKIENAGQVILIDRDHDGWKMTQPVEDLVEPTAVDALLYSVTVQKGKAFHSGVEAKAVNWAEYGLDAPQATLEIKTTKDNQKLLVSSKHAFDGSFYVRLGDELLIADKALAQAVLRDAKMFRSRRLWRDADATIENLQIKMDFDGQKDDFKIVKDQNGKWALDPAPKFPIENGRLERWVAALQGLSPNEVAAESLTPEETRSDLLLKPSYILHANYKKSDGKTAGEWILTVGQDRSDDVFMYTNQKPTVYRAKAGDMSALRVGRAYFRDGKPPFRFPIEQARSIEVKDGPFKYSFKKSDLVWKLVDAAEGRELDQDKLITMMQRISALEAQEFMPKASTPSFKNDQEVIVRNEKGEILFQLRWGAEYKAKQAYNKGMTFRYIETNLEAEAMGVPTAKVASLIDKSMVRTEAPKKVEQK